MDWLLLGIFGFMSLTIISRANIKTDRLIIFVGICGGLAIESWGTQTNLWHYYTAERPPLWIIPAWPIASLSIDRITRGVNFLTTKVTKDHKGEEFFKVPYWLTFTTFLGLMLVFVSPTFDKSFTWLAVGLCVLLILTPTDHCFALLTFFAGAGLGYYLELWGTTRECWTYYTNQTPPLFAVLAHGMAAVAFWRSGTCAEGCLGEIQFLERTSIPSRGRNVVCHPQSGISFSMLYFTCFSLETNKRKFMQTEKVHFTKEKETMLVTLYGRALETQSQDPTLRDPAAVQAVQRIDYDFESLNVKWNDIHAIAARAKVFDLWVEEFLAKNPRAVVLHLGCGLDSRLYRIDPPVDVLWFDVDYPETIELRRRLFPERANYRMIGSSVTDRACTSPTSNAT